jgi:hypothetical protein
MIYKSFFWLFYFINIKTSKEKEMKRKNFYENLPTPLLGAFYCFVQKKIKQGENLNQMLFEKSLIEKVSKERKVSLLELRILGRWFLQKERNLTNDELDKNEPL